jgi:hypothetical protein
MLEEKIMIVKQLTAAFSWSMAYCGLRRIAAPARLLSLNSASLPALKKMP